jgi:hypothetical protein
MKTPLTLSEDYLFKNSPEAVRNLMKKGRKEKRLEQRKKWKQLRDRENQG